MHSVTPYYILFENIFIHSEGCLSIFLVASFDALINPIDIFFPFVICILGVTDLFSSKNFIFLAFIFNIRIRTSEYECI